MVFVPLYFPVCDSSPTYRYKEKRVESKVSDRLFIKYNLDMVIYKKYPWYKQLWLFCILPKEVIFYITLDRKHSKEIERALESGEDFLTVYKNYKNKAHIDDTSDYDDLFDDFSERDLTEIGKILRNGYKVDYVVAHPVTWYERDYSEREVYG